MGTSTSQNYGLFKSSIGKKVFMALTGLFLCTFLIGHLVGNLQLFIGGDAGRDQFNAYAAFMTTNPAVKILSYLTYFSVLFHVVGGIRLTMQNRAARPVKYHYKKDSANSMWSSRNMGVLGTIILVFLATHMMNFWYVMHFGEIATQPGTELKDLHAVVMAFFNPAKNSLAVAAVAFYVISMIALGFHLWHGFASGFQSLGLNHPAYMPIIKKVGMGFSVIVPALFASIPVYLLITA